MDVIIRRADEADFPAVVSLIHIFALFQGALEKVSITAEQMMLERQFFQCMIAETTNQEIVGFATFFPAYYSWTGKALYLDDLFVRDVNRRQGIGKRLLAAVIDHARAQKCRKIRWQVSKWNTNAIQFYKSIGATIDEVDINCDYTLT